MDVSQGKFVLTQPLARNSYVVVFDINYTLCTRNINTNELESIKKNHPECPVINWTHNGTVYPHVFVPYLQILFDYLLEKGVRIVFFTYADEEKNNTVIPELLSSFWGSEKFEALKSRGQFSVFSREDMRENYDYYVKDLNVVIRDGESLSDVILVEDDDSFVAYGQKPCVLVMDLRHWSFCTEDADDFSKNNIYYMFGVFTTYFENEKYNELPLREGLRKILPAGIEYYSQFKGHPFTRNMIDVGFSFVRKLVPSAIFYGLKEPKLHQYAVENRHKDIVEILLNSRLTVNAKGVRKNLCTEEKWVEFVQRLLVSGVVIKKVPELLHLAVEEGFLEVCKLLVENGADVNALNSRGDAPLHLSCVSVREEEKKQKKDEIVKLLLNSGADVNVQKQPHGTAFHFAAYYGRKGAVHFFLDYGTDVDLRAEDGATPLHLACESGQKEIAEILLDNKANVNSRQKNGNTPLHSACFFHAELVKLLLKFGADIEARGPENQTPFLYAFSQGSDYAVEVLLDSGCDFDAKADGKGTVLDIALSEARSKYNLELKNREFDIVNLRNFPCEFLDQHRMISVLKSHMVKLEAAELYICGENINQFDCAWCDTSDFQPRCKEEVEKMKKEQLNSQFTLFDVLKNLRNPTFARNESLVQTIEDFNFEKFPIYKSLIVLNLQRSKLKLELLNAGQRALNVLMKTSSILNGKKRVILPAEILELIILYLRHSDINSLISCVETLKCQLKGQ